MNNEPYAYMRYAAHELAHKRRHIEADAYSKRRVIGGSKVRGDIGTYHVQPSYIKRPVRRKARHPLDDCIAHKEEKAGSVYLPTFPVQIILTPCLRNRIQLRDP